MNTATAKKIEDIVLRGAEDSLFYSQAFFPQVCRTKSPPFHDEIWRQLEDTNSRYFAAMVFRDGAKTSLLRMYTSKRIAYGLSRTILFVGKGLDAASRSVQWLARQVEENKPWATTFQLTPGSKWTDTEIEIYHGIEKCYIRVLAVGITGQVRGVNIDSYRPDLIVVDDPCDHDNTATAEARQKTDELFFGAIYPSLAPSAESPLAKLALLQTPLQREDLINTCVRDPQFNGVVYSCFDEAGESRWPERKPTEMLLQEKEGYTARRQLPIWYREMECKLVAPETSAFDGSWLRTYDRAPEGGVSVLAIDPVPPPTEVQIAKGLRDKDYEVQAVVKRVGPDYYVLKYDQSRGHTPDRTIAAFFSLVNNYKPWRAVVETVAYQKTLQWLLQQAMQKVQQYIPIMEYKDKRKKFDRIVDTLNGLAFSGHLYVHPSMTEFIDQFTSYPDVSHDDLLDAVAIAIIELEKLSEYATHLDSLDPAALPPAPPRRRTHLGGIP